MKKLIVFIGVLVAVLLLASASYAQSVDSTEVEDYSFARASVSFSSNSVYLGRSDSLATPYLTPSFGYYHKSGLRVSGSLSYLASAEEQRVDVYTLSAGYDFYKKNFSAEFSLYNYFYSEESFSVLSTMNTYLNSSIGYEFKAVDVYTDLSLGFSEGIDVFWNAEISKGIYVFDESLKIVPSFMVKAGTQQFYDEFFSTRSTLSSTMKHGGGSQTTTTSDIQVTESEQFKILAIETDLYLLYRIKDWGFVSSITYAIPVNPAIITTTDGSFEEELNNTLFWSAGVRYTILK